MLHSKVFVSWFRSAGELLRRKPSNDSRSRPCPPLVVVVGPSPGQAGGISSVMSYLRTEVEQRDEYDLMFVNTLKGGRWSFTQFSVSVAQTAWYIVSSRAKHRPVIAHLNVSVRGSTYRKWFISLFCMLSGTPYVLHLHGGRYPRFFRSSTRPVRLVTLALFARASRVVVLGTTWRDFVVKDLGVKPGHVAVVPNGTPKPQAASLLEPKQLGAPVCVVFSGRLDAKKGVYDLLQAADSLYADFQNFKILLMGDSRDSSLLSELRSRPYCEVVGWLPHGQVVDQLTSADIFALPSHDEGLPMAMLEAMSLGLPVIVTAVGAIPDVIVDGREGYLIEPRDIPGLTTALRSLVLDASLRRKMGEAAYHRWQTELGSDRMARSIESQWQSALNSTNVS